MRLKHELSMTSSFKSTIEDNDYDDDHVRTTNDRGANSIWCPSGFCSLVLEYEQCILCEAIWRMKNHTIFMEMLGIVIRCVRLCHFGVFFVVRRPSAEATVGARERRVVCWFLVVVSAVACARTQYRPSRATAAHGETKKDKMTKKMVGRNLLMEWEDYRIIKRPVSFLLATDI